MYNRQLFREIYAMAGEEDGSHVVVGVRRVGQKCVWLLILASTALLEPADQ